MAYRRIDPAVPWYDAVQCDGTAVGPRLALWAMVYRPEFARWQAGGEGVARAAILAPRRAAGQGRFELEAMTIAVDSEDLERIAGQLAAGGMVRTDGREGTSLAGDGWTLTLRRAVRAPGLESMTLSVDRRRSRGLTLGRARLEPGAPRSVVLRFPSIK